MLTKYFRTERFELDWRRLFIMGVLIVLTGSTLVLASMFNADAMVSFAPGLSWLPLSGLIILILGIVECLEAFFAKESREFHQNLQVGVLDSVIGALIFLSIAEEINRYSMMIAAFLIVRGIVRMVMVVVLKLPHAFSTSLGGGISIVLGLMIWQQWPTTEGWFVALCLNVEIAFRGWAIMMFSLWLRKQQVLLHKQPNATLAK